MQFESRCLHEFTVEGQPVRLLLPGASDHVSRIVRATNRFYEHEMLFDIRSKVKPGSAFIDVGAHVGNHTVFFGLMCRAGRVYSFEPVPFLAQLLRENVRLNNLEDVVTVYEVACGEAEGRGALLLLGVPGNWGLSRVREQEDGPISVVSLDQVIREERAKLARIDVLKVDVEGSEFEVLKGAKEILAEFHPICYIEASSPDRYQEIERYLSKFGYVRTGVFNHTPTYRFEFMRTQPYAWLPPGQTSGPPSTQRQASVSSLPLNEERHLRARSHRRQAKIVFLAGDSGNFTFAIDIIRRLQQRGFQIRVVDDATLTARDLLRHMEWADIAWFEWGNGPIIPASHMPKVCRILCRIHRYEVYTDAPRRVNWANVDDLIFVSHWVLQTFKALHDPSIGQKTRVHVVPNGVDVEKLPFRERGPGFNLGWIGRFHPHKNPALLVQIMAELVKRDSRYKCSMIGPIQDPVEYQYVMRMVEQLGLERNVVYEGVQRDVVKWLEDKNYILSTSVVESQGMAIMEGMAMGIKPVIHNWVGEPQYIYRPSYVFNTVEEAVNMITGGEYNSGEYRTLVAERYSLDKTMHTIETLLLRGS